MNFAVSFAFFAIHFDQSNPQFPSVLFYGLKKLHLFHMQDGICFNSESMVTS